MELEWGMLGERPGGATLEACWRPPSRKEVGLPSNKALDRLSLFANGISGICRSDEGNENDFSMDH